jgi:hypothetical protein
MRMKMPWDESKANLQTRKSSRSRFYPGLYTQGERLLQWNFSTPLELKSMILTSMKTIFQMLRTCAGLVTVDKESRIILLVHSLYDTGIL